MISIIGFIASLTSTISLLPQLYLTYKTKKSQDISLTMIINFIVCSISWVIYGFLTSAIAVWATNVIITLFSIVMLIFKIKYKGQ